MAARSIAMATPLRNGLSTPPSPSKAGATRGFDSARLHRHSIMNERLEPFGPPSGKSVAICFGSVVSRPSASMPQPTGTCVPASRALRILPFATVAVDMSSDEGWVFPGRDRDRQRIGRHAGHARAVIRHQRAGRRHHDAGHAGVRRLQREIPDRAGVRDVARRAPADMHLARPRDRLVHRARHGDGARRAIGFEHGDGAGAPLDPHVGAGLIARLAMRSR